jgi:hypothetical protein
MRAFAIAILRNGEWTRETGRTAEAAMAYDADPQDTIEWGDREGRVADRRGRSKDDPDEATDAPVGAERLTAKVDQGPGERVGLLHRVNPYALGCLLGGFVALLGAQYLPWAHLNAIASSSNDLPSSSVAQGIDVNLNQFNQLMSLCYHLTLPLVLAGAGAAVIGAPRIRRTAAALALGLLGGQAALLVTVARDIQFGSVEGPVTPRSGADAIDFGPGFSIAVLATLLLVAAAVLAVRQTRRRRELDAAAELEAAAPLDLTVSQVTTTTQWEPSR